MGQEGGSRAVKAKTKKGQRALERKAPKLDEDAKRLLVLQGSKSTQLIKDVLGSLSSIKLEQAVKLSRKNPIWPFEPGHEASLQFLCDKADCSLFCLGNHNKKRPNNLLLGRMYDFQLLDMIEFGILRHEAVRDFPGASLIPFKSQPSFIFLGEEFDSDSRYKLAKNILLDVLSGKAEEEVNLAGLSQAVVVTAGQSNLLQLRRYAVRLKKSGTQIPRVALVEAGPRLDLELRRIQEAPQDLMREALRQPQKGKLKEKNVGFDSVEGKVGRLYLPKQDIGGIVNAKAKGVKRAKREAAADRKRVKVARAASSS